MSAEIASARSELLGSDAWFPIGRADDAPPRHVFQAKLLGRELAVWRADDGWLNVWENRCLHRGVRLSIGLNEGSELKCMYHGWRYASRTGGCTYVPAHPADAPARTICNRTFPVSEGFGLIWTRLGSTTAGGEAEPAIEGLDGSAAFALRSLHVAAPPDLVLAELATYRFAPSARLDRVEEAVVEVVSSGPRAKRLTSTADGCRDVVVLLVQPCDSGEAVIHAVLRDEPAPDAWMEVWRHHAHQLARVRGAIEAEARLRPSPMPLPVALERIEPSDVGPSTPRTRLSAELRVVVDRKWDTAEGVVAFELSSIAGTLPTTQPGAHIDVHLPNGLIRQYSLTNQSGQQASYVIGVKREPESRGGSSCLHDTVRVGDVLAISAPRNNFTLRRDAVRSVLIAGGIGVTPLLSMAETLHQDQCRFEIHCFAQSAGHVAFADRLAKLGDQVVAHLGLGPKAVGHALSEVLAGYQMGDHVYVCGPGPLLDAARVQAAELGWPDESVHFEYFKNTLDVDSTTSFRVHMARSATTVEVHAGETILEVLRSNGAVIASSCEQGACGTCVLGVIDGEVQHQDVYLRPNERAAGDRIVTCVSRAMFDELTLDI